MRFVCEAYSFQQRHGASLRLAFPRPGRSWTEQAAKQEVAGIIAHPEQQVVDDGQRAERAGVLPGTGNARAGAFRHPQAVDPPAFHGDAAGILPHYAGDQVEQGRLAGTVRADQADDFARVQTEGDVVGDGDTAEALAQTGNVQNGTHVRAANGLRPLQASRPPPPRPPPISPCGRRNRNTRTNTEKMMPCNGEATDTGSRRN